MQFEFHGPPPRVLPVSRLWFGVGLALLACLSAPVAAGIPPAVAKLRAEAQQLARTGKVEDALDKLSRAREMLRNALAKEQRPARPRVDPVRQREAIRLNQWLQKEVRTAAQTGRPTAPLLAEYERRTTDLHRRYPTSRSPDSPMSRWTVEKTLADCEEETAQLQKRLGRRGTAQANLESAYRRRMVAHRQLGARDLAAADASRLLKLPPKNLVSFEQAGRLLHELGMYRGAVDASQQGVRSLASLASNREQERRFRTVFQWMITHCGEHQEGKTFRGCSVAGPTGKKLRSSRRASR